MGKKYVVELTRKERALLEGLTRSSKTGRSKLLHAFVLLKSDESPEGLGWKDAEIAESYGLGLRTVERIRERFVEEGLEAALNRKPSNRVYRKKIEGEQEAHLIAAVCSTPPQGHSRWTLKLLADKMVSLNFVDSVSPNTIGRVLKKRTQTLE